MWDDVLASLATAPVSSGSTVLRPHVASLDTVNPSCIWHMMDPGEEGCRVVACVTASHAAMPKLCCMFQLSMPPTHTGWWALDVPRDAGLADGGGGSLRLQLVQIRVATQQVGRTSFSPHMLAC